MGEAVIVSAARTAFGRFGGGLQPLKAVDLGGIVITEAVKRAGIAPQQVDYVYMGQVLREAAARFLPVRPRARRVCLGGSLYNCQ
jgi:acetyl-CoA C-acetyltransferase